MIEIPYVMASRIPFLRSSFARFRKKLTVIGMIGHTQGVSRATSPPIIPMKKMYQRELLLLFCALLNAANSFTTGVHRSASGVL